MSLRRITPVVLSVALAAAALLGAPAAANAAVLYPDGSLDGAFSSAMGTGFGGSGRVLSVAVQPDGRTLAGGIFPSFDGTTSPSLARLKADGSVDAPFSAAMGTGLNDWVTKVSLQSDGKVIVGGDFTALNGVAAVRLARLNADGSPDTAFNAAVLAGGDHSGFDAFVCAIAVQPDGKLLIGGSFNALNGVSRPRLVRLNTDGSVDEAFSTALGSAPGSIVNDIALQPDGGILLGSDFPQSLIRLNPSGAVDTAFRDAQGTGFDGEVKSIALQSDGRIVVGGYFTAAFTPGPVRVTTGRIARLSTAGVLDTAFSAKASFDSFVFSVAVQSDDSIVLAGDILTSIGGHSLRNLRLAADGSVDSTYATNSGDGPDDLVHSLAIGPDGRTVLGGRFGTFNATTSLYLARLIGPSQNLSSLAPSTGPTTGGSVVTLTGSGFTGTPSVTVGGVACTSPTVVSSTTITCVVGAHAAGTVDVTVVNDSTTPGHTLHLAQAFTYSRVDIAVTAASPPAVKTSTAVPAISYTTSPASVVADWSTQPTCAVYSSTDTGFTTPLTGVQPAGLYVTHCAGGTSATFTPTSYVNGSLLVDGSKPTVSVTSLPVIQSSISFPVAWTAADTGAGVQNTDVRYRKALWSSTLPSSSKSSSFTTWKSASTSRSATFTGVQGYKYCFSTRARDLVGNISNWSAEKCTTTPFDERTLATSGTWKKYQPTGWVAKTALLATAKGAQLTTKTTVSVKQVAFVALKCKTCGSVVVQVGATKKSVSLVGTSSTGVRTLFKVALSAKTKGTVALVVTSSGKTVKVDAIGFSAS